MVITELILQDVLRIKAARIAPGGNVVKISGKNAAGKSSILSGIEFILRGPTSFPEKPVREGCEQGAGRIDLDDIIITRHLSPHKLVVQYKGSNEAIKRPQEFLDALLSRYTCDPIKLLNLPPQDQMEEIKKILNIDFTDIDKEYDLLYEKRRDLKRDAKALESLTKGFNEDSPVNQIDDAELLAKHSKARDVNTSNAKLRFELENERDKVKSLKGEESKLEEQLRILREEITKRTEDGKALADKVDGLVDVDEAALFDEIQRVQKHNAEASENKKVVGLVLELNDNVIAIEKAESRMAEIKEHKINVMKDAKFSIDGLSIRDNALFLGDVPLAQASQAEQIKACLALSVAGRPDISVVLVRQASLLDEESLELVAKMAEEMNFQVWLEIVGDSDPLSFIIEEGEVKHSPGESEVKGQVKLL